MTEPTKAIEHLAVEVRPCHFCGQPTRHVTTEFLQSFISLLNRDPSRIHGFRGPSNWQHGGAMCDECYDTDNARCDEAAIAEVYTPDLLLAASDSPSMPSPGGLMRELVAVLAGNKEGAFLTGEPGTGKTTQLGELVRRWCNQVKSPCRYVTEGDLMRELGDFKNRDTRRALHTFQNIPLLVIDDIGTRRRTEWVYSMYFDVIDARYRKRKPTVLASNEADLSQIKTWDARVVRRALELCGAPVVVTKGTR